jgi:hypothetical protein
VRWPVYARRWKDNEKEKKKASVKLTEILPYVCYIYIQKKKARARGKKCRTNNVEKNGEMNSENKP